MELLHRVSTIQERERERDMEYFMVSQILTRLLHLIVVGSLVRIGPEDSQFQIVFLSTYTMGYDMPIFGKIRQYVYGPYIAFVCLCFIVAELKRHHRGDAAKAMKSGGSLWCDDGNNLEPMTMETFLDVSRLGKALCLVDGRILDITDFIDNHPGGPDLLRYVKGSDITGELLGERDVDGLRHVHSKGAMSLLKRYVIAKLVGESKLQHRGSMTSSELISTTPRVCSTSPVFRRGKVMDVKFLTPRMEVGEESKPVVLVRLALPRTNSKSRDVKQITSIPGCTFTFRGLDERGVINI